LQQRLFEKGSFVERVNQAIRKKGGVFWTVTLL
jgi:hypothetical protein